MHGGGEYDRIYTNRQLPDRFVKVNADPDNNLEAISAEFEVVRSIMNAGIPVLAAYEIVKFGNEYGILYQRVLSKKSIGRICIDHPERIPQMADMVAGMFHDMTSKPCDQGLFPSRKQQVRDALEKYSRLSDADRQKLSDFIDSIPDSTTCLHGEFHAGNVIVSSSQAYWVDLRSFCYGDPGFDIGHLLFAATFCNSSLFGNRAHMSKSQYKYFWDCFVYYYLGDNCTSDSAAAFTDRMRRFAALEMLLSLDPDAQGFTAFFQSRRLHSYINKYF